MCSNEVRTVLVTGGAGFIGSHLICALRDRYPHWNIINVDNLDYCSSLKNLKSVEGTNTYKFIQGDICDPLFINHVFSGEKIDVVFHCAAQTHVDASFQCPSRFMQVNAEGTRVLLQAAQLAAVWRFIYISTDEVYGPSTNQPFDEFCPKKPSNPYSSSKSAAENVVMSFWNNQQLPVIITRSSNVYGPQQYYEKVIPRFLLLLQQQRKCTVQGAGLQSRHFLYVDDVTEAFMTVMEQGTVGEIYNIGSSFEISILQLAKELVKMKVESLPNERMEDWIEFVEDRPVSERSYNMTSHKLHSLGWRPKVSWTEGIRRTVRWYEENPNYWPLSTEEKNS